MLEHGSFFGATVKTASRLPDRAGNTDPFVTHRRGAGADGDVDSNNLTTKSLLPQEQMVPSSEARGQLARVVNDRYH